MSRDVQCKVACGVCCDQYWYQAFEYEELEELSECPHLTDKGCTLRREDRPSGCTEYLCALGQAAKHMSDDEIRQVLEKSQQEWPSTWADDVGRRLHKKKVWRRIA